MTSIANVMPEIFSISSPEAQRFSSIFKAEFKRLLHKKAFFILFVLLVVSEAVFLGLTIVSFDVVGGAFTQVSVANGFISMFYLIIGIYIVCSVSKEHEDKTTLSTLMVVPDRARLFAGRLLVWIVAAVVFGILGYLISLFAMFPYEAKLEGALDAGEAFACLLQTAVICAFVSSIGFCVATIFRRVGLGLMVYLILWTFGSFILTSVASMLPEAAANFVAEINKLLPSSLVSALSFTSPDAFEATFKPLFAMLVWVAGSIAGSFAIFKKVTK